MDITIDYGRRHWLTEQEQIDECISLLERHPLNPVYERHGGFIFNSEQGTSFRIAFYDIPYTLGFTTSDVKLISTVSAIIKSNTNGYNESYRKAYEGIKLSEQLQQSEAYKEFLRKQAAQKVHFKRHGSADWLELQGLGYQKDDYYYIQFFQRPGRLSMEHVILGHVQTEVTKYVTGMDYEAIENHIADFIGVPVNLEHFVESYHIGRAVNEHPTDRDLLNGIDVSEMTVEEVLESTGIKLHEYFKSWHITPITDKLSDPNDKILSMKFNTLYRLIRDNHHHPSFQDAFNKAILL